jgi:hypothetical protein
MADQVKGNEPGNVPESPVNPAEAGGHGARAGDDDTTPQTGAGDIETETETEDEDAGEGA